MIGKIAFVIVILLLSFQVVSSAERGFELSIPLIKSVVKQGDIVRTQVSVINVGDEKIFEVAYGSEINFLSIDEDAFLISEDGAKTIEVVLDSSGISPGAYTGQISFNSEGYSHKIPVIFEVESARTSFDSFIEINPESSLSRPGGTFESKVKIVNLVSPHDDVTVDYLIKNLEGVVILEDSEALSVANQIEFVKSYTLPENLEEGNYVFAVKTRSGNEISTSSALFEVSSEEAMFSPENGRQYYLFASFAIILVLVVAFLLFNHFWNRRVVETANDWNKKLVNLKRVKFSDIGKEIRNLEYKKAVLKKAYEKGYVSRSSYEEGRKKMNLLLAALKKRL